MPSPLDHGEPCTVMKQEKQPDGLGGQIVRWETAMTLEVCISLDRSAVARIAEQQGVQDLYTMMVKKDAPLAFGDYLRREADGRIFRITSSPDEQSVPDISGMDYKVFTAAKTLLPSE